MKRTTIIILIIVLVLILDQWLKVYIKLNFGYGQEVDILGLSWAKLHFVENKGMAFGLSFGGDTGKLILTTFRIVMVAFLFYWIRSLIKEKESIGFLICIALIIAGALGNIIDSIFYGVLFSESGYHSPAVFMPEEGGYAPMLYGKVVDMFYFPMIDTVWPEWVPYFGGNRFRFFQPVFNVADSAITTGVASILIFHRSFFKKESEKEKAAKEAELANATQASVIPMGIPHHSEEE